MNARVQHESLLQGCAHCTVQAILEVEDTLVLDHVGKQIAIERGVVSKQCVQVEGPLCGDQIRESHLARRYRCPVARGLERVLWVWAAVAYAFEDHGDSLLIRTFLWCLREREPREVT